VSSKYLTVSNSSAGGENGKGWVEAFQPISNITQNDGGTSSFHTEDILGMISVSNCYSPEILQSGK
jgi:hypothetical protein